MGKFDAFFQVRRNVIYARARFHRRNQLPGEQYIMALYNLAANCEYGRLENEMIRDRLVVGIRDSALSERLQMDAELTLDKAKKQIPQREAVHQQQCELKGAEQPSLEALHSSKRNTGQRLRSDVGRGRGRGRSKQPGKTCTRCGKDAHPRDKCPAKDAECYRCKRKGHCGAMSLSKTVAANSVEASDLIYLDTEVAFLDNVSPAK